MRKKVKNMKRLKSIYILISGFDKEVLKNFRPLSNLTFISKILEKISRKIGSPLDANSLRDTLQSKYWTRRSTDTALMKVHNDIVTPQDQQSSAVLILLDFSAAFDVIDHSILFQRLTASCGFRGTAASWIEFIAPEKATMCYRWIHQAILLSASLWCSSRICAWT